MIDDSSGELVTQVLDAIAARDSRKNKQLMAEATQSLNLERTANKFKSIRDIVVSIIFGVTIIGGGTVAVSELQQKPDAAQMQQAIDAKVDPLSNIVEPMQETVKEIGNDLTHVQKLQSIQVEHAEWRAEVSDCRADKKCRKPPAEPATLKQKKRDMLTK